MERLGYRNFCCTALTCPCLCFLWNDGRLECCASHACVVQAMLPCHWCKWVLAALAVNLAPKSVGY